MRSRAAPIGMSVTVSIRSSLFTGLSCNGPTSPKRSTFQAGIFFTLRVKGKKIPAWKVDRFGLVGPLQDSPVKSDERMETVTLIPMGAARLRISAFPLIGFGSQARD